MRVESTGGSGKKVWLTDDEIEQLRRNVSNQRDDLIILLGGYVGLRAFEIPQIKPKHIHSSEGGDHYFLRVEAGKDTTGGGGKTRDAYLPTDVELQIRRFANENNISPNEPLVDMTTDSVRAAVKRVAGKTAEDTGIEDFNYVSSHDLRRRFAQRLAVDERVNPRVVMAVGGWDSFAALEPYLNKPSESVITSEMENAGLTSL